MTPPTNPWHAWIERYKKWWWLQVLVILLVLATLIILAKGPMLPFIYGNF